jgi:uncharacterized Rossmann fold enzyme
MDFEVWEPYYKQILSEFGFRKEDDERSASILSELLIGKELASEEELRLLIQGKSVVVVGGGRNIIEELDNKINENVMIAADGTTSYLLKKGFIPDIIVTDLDGNIEDQISANQKGAIVAIHAHGDNMENIKFYSPKFSGKVIGTVQCRPFGNLHNFGGFTDGDRGVFIAEHFGADNIRLAGFDFENVGDKPNCNKEIKLRKLGWAKKLITILGVSIDE